MGQLGFRIDPIGADREVLRDVVQHDVDLVEGNARALMVGEAIEGELQHPVVPVGC